MSHRLQIIVPDQVYDVLVATAAARASRPSTIAAQLVIDDITSRPFRAKRPTRAAPEDDESEPVSEQCSDEPTATPPAERAGWLELDRGHVWRAEMWDTAIKLRAAYPDLADIMGDGWQDDRFTRDGILALVVWRRQIDQRSANDPRVEMQWLTALRDFSRIQTDHRRLRHRDDRPPSRPADW